MIKLIRYLKDLFMLIYYEFIEKLGQVKGFLISI